MRAELLASGISAQVVSAHLVSRPGGSKVTDKQTDREEFHPRGTAAIAAIFILTMILMWGSVYVILLARGVTS